MENNKSNKSIVLFMDFILTVFGTVLAIVLLVMAIKSPSILGVLGSITYFITYIFIIMYATRNYTKSEDIFFKSVLYSYASVLGIQILQAGHYISDYGLTENVALVINCCNLISFANIIKSSDNLKCKKIALSYIVIAVVLKLIVEISLIIKMICFIQFIHILMSLSIPILGLTIIIAYICRVKRINCKN